jgi:hypothetical protein
MTANPLIGRTPTGGGRVTEDRLHAYAAELNGKAFVKAFGWGYFVGRDDQGKARLDRRG